VLNILFVPAFVSVLRVPFSFLGPLIVIFCIVGVYSVTSSVLDLWVMLVFGAFGFCTAKLGYPAAPMILALVIGDSLETSLRQSLMMSKGDLTIFFGRPISGTLMALLAVIAFWPLLPWLRNRWRMHRDVAPLPVDVTRQIEPKAKA